MASFAVGDVVDCLADAGAAWAPYRVARVRPDRRVDLFSADGGPAIEQIPKLPVPLWFGMTLAIGIAETLRIQKGWANPYEKMENVQALKPEYNPGDLGFDPLGLKPESPAELKEMQTKELNNGRLAMIGVAGMTVQELSLIHI